MAVDEEGRDDEEEEDGLKEGWGSGEDDLSFALVVVDLDGSIGLCFSLGFVKDLTGGGAVCPNRPSRRHDELCSSTKCGRRRRAWFALIFVFMADACWIEEGVSLFLLLRFMRGIVGTKGSSTATNVDCLLMLVVKGANSSSASSSLSTSR